MTKVFLVVATLLLFNSCRIEGCMDPEAVNFNPGAKVEGTCRYFEYHGIQMAPCDLTDLSFDKVEEKTENGRPVLHLTNSTNTDYIKLFFVDQIESGQYYTRSKNGLSSQSELAAEYQHESTLYEAQSYNSFYVEYNPTDLYVSYCYGDFDKVSGSGDQNINDLLRIHVKR
jgi:hypothetical protein